MVDVSTPTVPADVCIPEGFPPQRVPIAFFDDFSWRSFVAMVWPAAKGQRGVADATKKVSDAGTRVFETFKSDWELFRPGGETPSGWDVIDQRSPCGAGPVGFDDLVLASFSKFGNFGEAGSTGELIHALPAQNATWVRYLTGFNKPEYERIVRDRLYIKTVLDKSKPLAFAPGALDVKSAWMEMRGISNPERYYRRTALAFDPVKQACAPIEVGLVGLHIVQRTESRPQWIWSSFEHVDAVPPSPDANRFAFNDGSGKPMLKEDPNGGFPPKDWSAPAVYNVDRIMPVDTRTEDTNKEYQKAIGGVWQFYKLVVTQWPLQKNPPKPIPPTQSGAPANTFPGLKATTGFANTTLETWLQDNVRTSCMACHEATHATDFVWALELHASGGMPPGPPPPSPGAGAVATLGAKPSKLTPALERLKAILEEARENARKRQD